MTSSIAQFRVAIDVGDLATVKRMVENDHDLLGCVVNADSNFRPLTEAAVECQLEPLAYLIAAGCDVNEDYNFPMFHPRSMAAASRHWRC